MEDDDIPEWDIDEIEDVCLEERDYLRDSGYLSEEYSE